MTNPFQSIIGDNPTFERDAVHSDEAHPSDKHVSVALFPHAPFINTLSARIETQLCSANENVKAASVPTLPPERRKPLRGGDYTKDEVLELLNSHYLIGKSEQEVAIFRIKDDGSLAFTSPEQFRLDVANIFVKETGRSSKLVAGKFWKESPERHQRKIVFKPPGDEVQPDEFNLWRGFGVEPRKGWRKQRRLLRHIFEIICRRDKAKFKYLIRWLAWLVQNPGSNRPETVIVLKSRKEGTGKSTLGVAMCEIFGMNSHGAIVDDKERLIGRFNDWIEPMCFILAEEILWAGDHRTADKLKSMITAPTNQIERKGGAVLHIPNRLHMIMTTNHDHAVSAGVGDRRNIVFDVSDERARDETWFDPIYADLADGGTGQFLYFLQKLKLANWHPREILKTAETTEQQRMSGDSVSQWSQACIDADAIIGSGRGPYGTETVELGTDVALAKLYEAYKGFCKHQHPVGTVAFGRACADVFGPRKRLPAETNSKSRPWGYHVPEGDKWQEKVDERLGIKK